MRKNNKTEPITKADLNDLSNKLEKSFDKKFKKIDKSIDIKLGKFTEEVLLPAVSEIVSNEIGKHRHEMKNYIDSKLTENKGDIISFIKGDKERDKSWKFKIINILEREKLAKPQELEILANLIK